ALFVSTAGEQGLRVSDLAARTGWTDEVLAGASAGAVAGGEGVDADGVYVSRAGFEQLARAALAAVEEHHRREPLARGLMRETLRERVFSRAAPELFRAALSRLEEAGAVVSEKEIVRASSHKLSLSAEDLALRERLEKLYAEAALEPPTLDEALERAAGSRDAKAREHGRKIFQLLLDDRTLVRVAPDLFFHRQSLERLTARLREHAALHEPARLIDVPTFKDLAGVTRKYAIPLLEHFDRERVTRRAGDKRIIL
ncbi:MAG TPA: SelB C-terminal domain-containing protein, partial [Pyrinomonadaceae bacterium]|nr:SelB C-terminal domain-containing protein [Pyrinomonadaceae bacterium]